MGTSVNFVMFYAAYETERLFSSLVFIDNVLTKILAFVFRLLYDVNDSIESKIETIAKKIYGADGIDISPEAQVAIDRYKKQGKLIQNQ